MTVAAQGSLRPSAVVGIGCDWCAYCFDEALVYRDWDAMRHAADMNDAEREAQAHTQNARNMMRGLRG